MSDYSVYKAFYDVIADAQDWIGQNMNRASDDISYVNGAWDMANKLLKEIGNDGVCE